MRSDRGGTRSGLSLPCRTKTRTRWHQPTTLTGIRSPALGCFSFTRIRYFRLTEPVPTDRLHRTATPTFLARRRAPAGGTSSPSPAGTPSSDSFPSVPSPLEGAVGVRCLCLPVTIICPRPSCHRSCRRDFDPNRLRTRVAAYRTASG